MNDTSLDGKRPTNEDAASGQSAAPSNRVDRAPRLNVMLMAVVETFQGKSSRHRVRDVSSGGARIDTAGGLQAGATVLVTIGTLEAVAATVVWVRPPLAGLQFAHSIDVEQATARAANGSGMKPGATTISPTAGWIENTRNPYRR